MRGLRRIGKSLLCRFGGWLGDGVYLRLMYYFQTGRVLHLRRPVTFNEKLQWLKLHDRREEYTTMVDKYAVKGYVGKMIGEEYIVRTLGVWERVEDIAWEELPGEFVLKTTHGGGGKGVVVCWDKERLDRGAAEEELRRAMKRSLYRSYREWPYKGVKPRVMAEELLKDGDGGVIKDYKFLCFDGEPMYCVVMSGRWGEFTNDFFDMEWNRLGVTVKGIGCSATPPRKPHNFERMRGLARRLSAGIRHVRVDFYEVGERVYFGELTFYSTSGYGEFRPGEWDRILGERIKLKIEN